MTDLLQQPRELLIPGLVAALAVLAVLGHRVRKLAKSEQPDKPLAKVAMLIGLGWGSEAVWELTGRSETPIPTPVRIALFCVFEIMFLVATMRAERHMAMHSWPGRPGQTVWGLATAMGIVAMFVASSPAEAALRLAIPLALAKLWWDGVTGGQAKPDTGTSSWRWTPRRALLAIGALEPGQKDVAKVQRDYLTSQMTKLYFGLGQGSDKARARRSNKLAKLSLEADVAIIAEVQRRVGQATWFLGQQEQLAFTPVASEEHETTPDPWDLAEPVASTPATPDVATQAASWLASTGGQAAVAKERSVATAKKPVAKYDQTAAKTLIRTLFDQMHPDLTKPEVDKAKAHIDAIVMAKFHVSERTARRLRGQVAGEPVSGPPTDVQDGDR